MTELIVFALATWRVTQLLLLEEGPGNVLVRVRHAAGVRYNDRSQPYSVTGSLGVLFYCPFCMSVWVGSAWTVLWLLWPAAVWLATPLALSAAAILVGEVVGHGSR